MDRSTIEVRNLATPAELQACVDLQHETWGRDFSDVVPASILKVSQRVGGVSAGAFDAEDTLVGFVFGLTGVERGAIVHWSDMLAVRPGARNLGVGRLLKEHQRRTVRALGGKVVYWTYDPLVARNAHLNFNRLGVRLAEYVENMYGVTDSILHGGLPTDRLVVAWPTDDGEMAECLSRSERALASADCRAAPLITDEWMEGAHEMAALPPCVRVEVPADIEGLIAATPKVAAEWRRRVRRALQWALHSGYEMSAFSLDAGNGRGYYLMTIAT